MKTGISKSKCNESYNATLKSERVMKLHYTTRWRHVRKSKKNEAYNTILKSVRVMKLDNDTR